MRDTQDIRTVLRGMPGMRKSRGIRGMYDIRVTRGMHGMHGMCGMRGMCGGCGIRGMRDMCGGCGVRGTRDIHDMCGMHSMRRLAKTSRGTVHADVLLLDRIFPCKSGRCFVYVPDVRGSRYNNIILVVFISVASAIRQ